MPDNIIDPRTHPHKMFRTIMDSIRNKNRDNVISLSVDLLADLKEKIERQQKKLKIIKNACAKIEKERLKKKKTLDKTIPFFNGVYIGQFNKKNLPNGKGNVMYRSMDEDHPEDTDMFFGEFFNGTKTGLGKYTFFSGRNIAQHAFTIPTYTGEWSSDNFHGLGSMIIDKFEDIHIYEGEFRNNKVFGFGKMTVTYKEGKSEFIGYFDDGTPIGFGAIIKKDKEGNIINEQSGLVEHDNSDENNKQMLYRFLFQGNNFWNNLKVKPKTQNLIKQIYKEVFEKVYFNHDIRTELFKKTKLKAYSLSIGFFLEVNSYWQKNSQNKKFVEFMRQQEATRHLLRGTDHISSIKELDKIIKENIITFKALKKTLIK